MTEGTLMKLALKEALKKRGNKEKYDMVLQRLPLIPLSDMEITELLKFRKPVLKSFLEKLDKKICQIVKIEKIADEKAAAILWGVWKCCVESIGHAPRPGNEYYVKIPGGLMMACCRKSKQLYKMKREEDAENESSSVHRQ